jgi:hypothetical protein
MYQYMFKNVRRIIFANKLLMMMKKECFTL